MEKKIQKKKKKLNQDSGLLLSLCSFYLVLSTDGT